MTSERSCPDHGPTWDQGRWSALHGAVAFDEGVPEVQTCSGAPDSSPRPSAPPSVFVRFRFPPKVIILAVRWYLRFGLSYRDAEKLLVERGIDVD